MSQAAAAINTKLIDSLAPIIGSSGCCVEGRRIGIIF
jgi:hypothetical protein